jgi:hypothetical protein
MLMVISPPFLAADVPSSAPTLRPDAPGPRNLEAR